MKKHFIYGILALLFCAACTKEENSPAAANSGDYCLIAYASGGDPEHAANFTKIRLSLASTLKNSNISITWLYKSDVAETPTVRYFSENGAFVQDEWDGGTEFDITSAKSLSEFLSWSAQRFPGKKYIFIPIGHGEIWYPATDNPATKSLIVDGVMKKSMTATALADGIRAAGLPIELTVTFNCIQNSIETVSEWQDCMKYLITTSSYLPDLGADLQYLVSLLGRHTDMAAIASDYVRHIGPYFAKYQETNGDPMGISVSAIDMRQIGTLNNSLKPIFAELKNSRDETCSLTDLPAVYGRRYANGYADALAMSLSMDEVEHTVAYTHDLCDFLQNAVACTGNYALMSLNADFKTNLDRAVIENYRSDFLAGHAVSFNLLTHSGTFADPEMLAIYRTSRFDRETGWSDFITALIGKLTSAL